MCKSTLLEGGCGGDQGGRVMFTLPRACCPGHPTTHRTRRRPHVPPFRAGVHPLPLKTPDLRPIFLKWRVVALTLCQNLGCTTTFFGAAISHTWQLQPGSRLPGGADRRVRASRPKNTPCGPDLSLPPATQSLGAPVSDAGPWKLVRILEPNSIPPDISRTARSTPLIMIFCESVCS